MADFDVRRMLDRYIYDYLIKKNMHQAAEVFMIETNLAFDLNVPPAIDVPEGFLLEWWTMSYEFDFFRAWLSQHVGTLGKAPSTMLKPRLEATQECNASQSGQYLINSQTNKQLLINSASTMSVGSKSMACHQYDKVSQVFSPSSHQERLLTTNQGTCTPVNFANTVSQKDTTHKTANTAHIEETDPWIENLLSSFWVFEQDQKELCKVGESSRNLDNLLVHEEKNTNMQKFASSISKTLLDNDNTSETSDCTSNYPGLSPAADASTVYQQDSNKER